MGNIKNSVSLCLCVLSSFALLKTTPLFIRFIRSIRFIRV